jgi:vacuolar-type H+-ATPase subunit I/STV1
MEDARDAQDVMDHEEQDFAGMDDAELDQAIGVDESGGENIESGEGSAAAKDGGEGGDKGQQEAKPPTVESLQAELTAMREQAEKDKRHSELREQTLGRQSNELGELRRFKQQIATRYQQLNQIDPQQQMINDPAGFRNAPYERMQLEQQWRDAEAREQAIAQQNAFATNRQEIVNRISDFEQRIDAVCDAAIKAGEHPQNVQRFRQNPYSFHPAVAIAYYQQARINDMQAEMEKLRAKPATMMQQVEAAARNKPLTNASGGSRGGSKQGDITDVDLANMSDKDFEALFKEQMST